MKTKQPWTLDEKAMVWVPTLLMLGAACYAWSAGRERGIVLDDALTYQTQSQAERNAVFGAQFSPDGRRLLVTYDGPNGGKAAVFDAASLEKLFELVPPVPNPKLAVASSIGEAHWAPDGQRIAGLFGDGTGTAKIKTTYAALGFRYNNQPKLGLWSATSGALLANLPYARVTYDCNASLRYSPNGQTLIGEGVPPMLFGPSGASRQSWARSDRTQGQFNADATLVAMQLRSQKRSQATPVEVFDVATKNRVWRANVKRSYFDWGGSGVLAVGDFRSGQDRRLILWNGKSRRVVPAPPDSDIVAAAVHPNRSWVAVAKVKTDGAKKPSIVRSELAIWNYATRKWMWRRAMTDDFEIKWSPDGRWLSMVENADDSRATLWIFDAAGELKHKSRRGNARIHGWSPDGQTLALSEGNRVQLVAVE